MKATMMLVILIGAIYGKRTKKYCSDIKPLELQFYAKGSYSEEGNQSCKEIVIAKISKMCSSHCHIFSSSSKKFCESKLAQLELHWFSETDENNNVTWRCGFKDTDGTKSCKCG